MLRTQYFIGKSAGLAVLRDQFLKTIAAKLRTHLITLEQLSTSQKTLRLFGNKGHNGP